MSQNKERLQGTLAKKYLGKRGIHGISIDESNCTVNVYVDATQPAGKALEQIQKDVGPWQVRAIESPRAQLA